MEEDEGERDEQEGDETEEDHRKGAYAFGSPRGGQGQHRRYAAAARVGRSSAGVHRASCTSAIE